MNRKNPLLPIIIVFFIFASCNGEKSPGKREAETINEIPPSLETEKHQPVLIQLSEKEQQTLKIETQNISSNFKKYSVTAPGVVFPAPEHSSIISTPINGQVRQINKFEGDYVLKGEVLFQIQSLEFGNLVAGYLQAFAEEQYQSNRLKRTRQLVEETISSASELERATAAYERASAAVRAALSKLKATGVTVEEIQSFTQTDNIDPVLKIHSPISGMVQQNFVEPGQSVNALETLSRVLDTRVVQIKGYLTPDDARFIHPGDSVIVSKRENDGREINTVVSTINPGLDEKSRSIVANIIVPTLEGWPRPGENVRLSVTTSSRKEILSIPLKSLTYDGNQPVVFVEKERGVFEKRPITLSGIRDNFAFVEKGLSSGEKVAITQVFSLKALSRFDVISEE